MCMLQILEYSTDSCKCLPGCSELYYKISSMNVPFNRSALLQYKKYEHSLYNNNLFILKRQFNFKLIF